MTPAQWQRSDAANARVSRDHEEDPRAQRRYSVLGYYRSKAVARRIADLVGHRGAVALALPNTPHGACRQPLAVFDRVEHRVFLRSCNSHRSKSCEPCARRYAARVRRVVHTGVLTRIRSGGHLAMLTITAPGDPGHLQWSVLGPRANRPVCGCERHLSGGLGLWNSQAGARWNVLRTGLRRLHPGAEYYRGVEVQKRGAIHLHVILWTQEPADVRELQQLALAAGFGCNVKLDVAHTEGEARRFSSYVTKYVTKSVDDRGDAPWVKLDDDTGELTDQPANFRTWSQSRGFGCTMKEHTDAIAAQRKRSLTAALEAIALCADTLGAVVLEGAPPSPPVTPDPVAGSV